MYSRAESQRSQRTRAALASTIRQVTDVLLASILVPYTTEEQRALAMQPLCSRAFAWDKKKKICVRLSRRILPLGSFITCLGKQLYDDKKYRYVGKSCQNSSYVAVLHSVKMQNPAENPAKSFATLRYWSYPHLLAIAFGPYGRRPKGCPLPYNLSPITSHP